MADYEECKACGCYLPDNAERCPACGLRRKPEEGYASQWDYLSAGGNGSPGGNGGHGCSASVMTIVYGGIQMAEPDAKSYLQQIKLYDIRINMKLDELAALKESLTRITPTLKDDVVSSSGSQDKLGDAVVKMVDLRNEINADIDRFVDTKRAVGATIDKVSDPDQLQVLHKRYVLYESFEQIAIEMGFTYRHITRIHGEALQSVKKILRQ